MAFVSRGASRVLPLWIRSGVPGAQAVRARHRPFGVKLATAAVVGGGFSLLQCHRGFASCEDVAGLSAGGVPPFDPKAPFYDPSTYLGRVRNTLDLIDVRLLLVGDEELERSKALLQDRASGSLAAGVTDEDLWRARRVVEGMVHPVTGEKMFILGRMSAFVLVNLPVAAGMLIHGPTSTMAAVFWQWVNQSNNVMCNFVNRSGASVDWSGIGQSYALATTVSCGLALAAGRVMDRNPRLKRFGVIVPYFAVIAASTANMFFSRLKEWTEGVPVFDAEGVERGTSAKAGLEGVVRTVVTRSWIIPMPLLLVTPAVMTGLRGVPSVAKRPALLIFSELCIIALCLQCALPLVLSMQPSTMELKASSLEPQFHGLRDSAGKEVEFLYANKGL